MKDLTNDDESSNVTFFFIVSTSTSKQNDKNKSKRVVIKDFGQLKFSDKFFEMSFVFSKNEMIFLVFLLVNVVRTSPVQIDPIVIQVNWTNHDYNLHTIPSLQLVTNPLVSRQFSPISKTIFDNLKQLNAEYARYAVWFPYPKLAVAELDPPSGMFQCKNVGESTSIELSCERNGGKISRIDFASYGTATGACGVMKQGNCHAANSSDVVQRVCVGQTRCQIPASNDLFGDPCSSSFFSCSFIDLYKKNLFLFEVQMLSNVYSFKSNVIHRRTILIGIFLISIRC